MKTRAAVNILGADGAVIDVTSLGANTITTEHPGPGQYLVHGTLGMVPPPEGWGYVLNQVDASCSVAINYNDGVLAVSVAKDGEPADLAHSITLHVAVDSLPVQVVPELTAPEADPMETAFAEITRLRSVADYAIAPLQHAVDVDESTDADLAALNAWERHRAAPTRVMGQPQSPAA
ncbi:tail fiber assembly protein, partial [Pseudomonas carnis]|uniref:tail fiber assembly protein n=1 Tax=Pseudomonas carnis TaxID=2487355 RepID=UPI001F27AF16